jgi:hypothetical protein
MGNKIFKDVMMTFGLIILFLGNSNAQVGMGTATPISAAALDITSTNKGFLPPRMTHAQKTAIASPAAGLTVWCTNCGSTGEMQVYNGSAWTNMVGSAATNPTSNGSAIVSEYAPSSTSAGTISMGTALTGVTQTITTTVATVGTYSVSAIANGITFAASGNFLVAGSQDIVLTATGTPTAVGTHTFTINTTPNINFSRTTNSNPSSNGTAAVSAYSCSTAASGSMSPSVAVSGVTQTITATVTSVGTYSIATTANGVTFAASGTFAGTGAQNIVLTAIGTPTASGTNTFTLNTTPNCNFSRTTEVYVGSVTSPNTGKIWMDRNLGASQVATAFNDALSYGDLYQWGRGADGHQLRTSLNTSTTSSSDVPSHGNFITNSSDWRNPQNNSLWQVLTGINNPCPSGYRLPTDIEFSNEESYFSPQSHIGAINSVLKLPMAGYRLNTNGVVYGQGTIGYYWTGTVSVNNSADYTFNNGNSNMNTIPRSFGLSVRCIKN